MKSGLMWLVIGTMAVGVAVVWMAVFQTIAATPAKTAITDGTTGSFNDEPLIQDQANLPTHEAAHYVPILMYHYIRDYQNAEDPLGIQLSVSPTTFERQLRTLALAGYETISLQDFIAGKIKPKSVILTFDDGYQDHFTDALPILERNHDIGTFFIVSGFIGRDRYMTKSQVQALKDAGMEVGGHTITHLNLASASYEKAVNEIFTSMRTRDPAFAYPSGKYSSETLDIVSGLGIKAAVTTNIGVASELSSPVELPRIRVKEHTDLIKIINEEIAITKKQLLPSQRSKN